MPDCTAVVPGRLRRSTAGQQCRNAQNRRSRCPTARQSCQAGCGARPFGSSAGTLSMVGHDARPYGRGAGLGIDAGLHGSRAGPVAALDRWAAVLECSAWSIAMPGRTVVVSGRASCRTAWQLCQAGCGARPFGSSAGMTGMVSCDARPHGRGAGLGSDAGLHGSRAGPVAVLDRWAAVPERSAWSVAMPGRTLAVPGRSRCSTVGGSAVQCSAGRGFRLLSSSTGSFAVPGRLAMCWVSGCPAAWRRCRAVTVLDRSADMPGLRGRDRNVLGRDAGLTV